MPTNYMLDGKDLAWVLEKPRAVEMEPIKGRLHLFDVPDELIRYI